MADVSQQQSRPEGETIALDEFSALVSKEFKPTSEVRQSRIEQAVATLAQQALADAQIIGGDVFATVDAMKAALDRKLTEQVNQILHHPDLQKLESAWRGLWYMVGKTSTGADLKIKVLNITKDETRRMLRQFSDAAWDQSPLFKKVYEQEYGQLGGQPYAAFVCDYTFDHSATDIDILRGLSKIGAAAHAPFIAAAGSSLLGMESWQELSNPRDLAKQFDATDYAAWRTFRKTSDSKYLALTMPRFLGRRLYGANSEPVDDFAFEEDTDGGKHANYLWCNSAYALGARITDAFKSFGWTTHIRGVEAGGLVEELPTAAFPTDDGSLDLKCPTEIAISDRREAELSKAGMIALVHRKNTDEAAFIGAQTLHEPETFFGSGATEANASANLSSRLTYIFTACRFAHYIKVMVRNWVGSNKEAPQLTADLQSWILSYVDPQPEMSDEETKARKPLKSAQVVVTPDEDNPGYYKGKFEFVPHYQLEGMDVTLSMVSRLSKTGS